MSRIAVVRCDICDENPALDDRGVCSRECLAKKHPPLPSRDYYNNMTNPINNNKSWYCTIV